MYWPTCTQAQSESSPRDLCARINASNYKPELVFIQESPWSSACNGKLAFFYADAIFELVCVLNSLHIAFAELLGHFSSDTYCKLNAWSKYPASSCQLLNHWNISYSKESNMKCKQLNSSIAFRNLLHHMHASMCVSMCNANELHRNQTECQQYDVRRGRRKIASFIFCPFLCGALQHRKLVISKTLSTYPHVSKTANQKTFAYETYGFRLYVNGILANCADIIWLSGTIDFELLGFYVGALAMRLRWRQRHTKRATSKKRDFSISRFYFRTTNVHPVGS